MAVLSRPFNPLELQDGQSVTFKVLAWATDRITITPAHAPQGKTVDVIRITVRPEDKPDFPNWYDITSAKLYAQLLAHLKRIDLGRLRFTIRAYGIPPKKSFSVDVRPE